MMNSKKRKSMENKGREIPAELIWLIFSKLPFVNLPSCRLVCKAWSDVVLTGKLHPSISISNHLFLAHDYLFDPNLQCLHLDPKYLGGMCNVAKFRFHPDFVLSSTYISIVNFCNGLLCCKFEHRTTKMPPYENVEVCILNPMTNEYFKPPISNASKDRWYYCYRFGFSPKTKQYKLVRFFYSCDKAAILLETFTFGTNCKSTYVSCVPSSMSMEEHSVYFNGSLYWIGKQLKHPTNVLYRLDIEKEELQEISFPQSGGCCSIGVFNGSLYLTLAQGRYHAYHVWKMEEDFSWTKAFDVLLPKIYVHHRRLYDSQLQLIRACDDGKILCLISGLDLILYNSKTQRMESLTYQHLNIKKVHRIDSFNFDSLHKILTGDA
ncbi:F-box/kelch-repeat protein At3g06240-like [Momordica charantia]|uniref:F-box/kelch-repeat protein At3g06240-like n=1 Tax=Momordica charantia TaxID=3673 RepID=A0A6J1CQE2_MOMCH|nr:F-box/kelch-repeat protein At3g06240-like [Momordica charantia]